MKFKIYRNESYLEFINLRIKRFWIELRFRSAEDGITRHLNITAILQQTCSTLRKTLFSITLYGQE